MATVPPKPTAQIHHGRLKWTTRWMGPDGKQKAQRFGDARKVPKRVADDQFAEWMEGWRRRQQVEAASGSRFTVRQMAKRCREWALVKFSKHGKPDASYCNFDLAMRDLEDVYGDSAADDVKGPEIVALRDNVFRFRWKDAEQAKDGDGKPIIQTARTVNYRLWCVKQAFRLAREVNGVSAETLADVLQVKRANPNDKTTRASRKVRAVPVSTVAATLAHASPVLADMIEFHRLTGCRPSEVCNLRPCDLEMPKGEPAVWFYVPPEHKTADGDTERVIVLPPAAVAIVRKYLSRPTNAACFSPKEHVTSMRMKGRAKLVGDAFDHTSYRRAVEWACKKGDVEVWQPNQLRHRWATEVRRTHGIEAAREGLSHHSTNVTEVYAELSRDRLREMALAM